MKTICKFKEGNFEYRLTRTLENAIFEYSGDYWNKKYNSHAPLENFFNARHKKHRESYKNAIEESRIIDQFLFELKTERTKLQANWA